MGPTEGWTRCPRDAWPVWTAVGWFGGEVRQRVRCSARNLWGYWLLRMAIECMLPGFDAPVTGHAEAVTGFAAIHGGYGVPTLARAQGPMGVERSGSSPGCCRYQAESTAFVRGGAARADACSKARLVPKALAPDLRTRTGLIARPSGL